MNIANKITIFRIILVFVFIALMSIFGLDSYLTLIVFVIAAITDFLDGHLARKYNLVTTFGKFLDPLADKLLTLSAFVMLTKYSFIPAWGVCLILARELAITGFRTVAASNGKTIAASSLGKVKTVSQFAAIILLLLNLDLGYYVFYLALIFTVLSGLDYFIKNKEALDLDNI